MFHTRNTIIISSSDKQLNLVGPYEEQSSDFN